MDSRKDILYTEGGELISLPDNTNTFRKIITYDREQLIYKILLEKQNELNTQSTGIVHIKALTNNSVDIELLDTNLDNYSVIEIKTEMYKVKNYLQSMGILYFDWKFGNIGISQLDGQLKLFDFDASGCINYNRNTWIIEPARNWFEYKNAVKAGMETPINIDNYAFENSFKIPRNKHFNCCIIS